MPAHEMTVVGLDEDFFASYEQELADIDIQAVASEALAGILTFKNEDGTMRTREMVRAETEAFFANDLIMQDMRPMDNLVMQYAQFCNGLDHQTESFMNEGSLSDVSKHGQTEGGHHHLLGPASDKDAKRSKRKSKKKTKKETDKKTIRRGWFEILWQNKEKKHD